MAEPAPSMATRELQSVPGRLAPSRFRYPPLPLVAGDCTGPSPSLPKREISSGLHASVRRFHELDLIERAGDGSIRLVTAEPRPMDGG